MVSLLAVALAVAATVAIAVVLASALVVVQAVALTVALGVALAGALAVAPAEALAVVLAVTLAAVLAATLAVVLAVALAAAVALLPLGNIPTTQVSLSTAQTVHRRASSLLMRPAATTTPYRNITYTDLPILCLYTTTTSTSWTVRGAVAFLRTGQRSWLSLRRQRTRTTSCICIRYLQWWPNA